MENEDDCEEKKIEEKDLRRVREKEDGKGG